jgi:DNA-binding LacI/PurR family transcriptional regulator
MTCKPEKIQFSSLPLAVDSPVPLHHQLSEGIMRELRQSRVEAGRTLPSVLQLSNDLKLNRATVRKAYAALESEQVIGRSPGGRLLNVTETFVRSFSARSLTAVGMVLPSRMEHLFLSEAHTALMTVSGIMDAAADLGFAAMVVPLPEEDCELKRLTGWLKEMLSKLNGLIYLGEDSTHRHDRAFELLLAEQSLPQVFISGHRFREHLGIVHVDLPGGADAAVDYLYGLGHRRFAVFGTMPPVREMFQLQTFDRIPEMARAVRRRANLPEKRVITGPPEVFPLAELREQLSASDRPTALLCASDRAAAKAIELANSMGLEVPRDLSVIGYGDTDAAGPLTSIHHPWLLSGRTAVEMVAESLRRNRPVNTLDRTLAAPLRIRRTTAAAPRAGG